MVKQRGYVKGTLIFRMGVNISTNLTAFDFVDQWNATKKELIANDEIFFAGTLAEMQRSPTAYIVGVAAGSTEDMDYQEINKGIEEIVGMKGVEVSFQNLY